MTTFEVTPSELQSLASRLAGLLGELEQAAANVSSNASGAAENGQLEGAINAFLTNWSSGLQSLKTKLDEIASRLGDAGEHYAGTDSDVASHFGTV